MYIRKSKYKEINYYYLARWNSEIQKEERLVSIGKIKDPNSVKENELVRTWVMDLLAGMDCSRKRFSEMVDEIRASNGQPRTGQFDLEKCYTELVAVYKKYGDITKTLLDKEARPRKEISFGVQTILKNLKKRGLSFKVTFTAIKQGESLEQLLGSLSASE